MKKKPKVVVVGGGFGGLTLVQHLAKADAEITLIDRNNHYVFQPLLYQVATAALSPADITSPFRSVLGSQQNLKFRLDEVVSIDRNRKTVELRSDESIPYDYLVLAPGNQPNYFGNTDWERLAPGLKSIPDALAIREKILLAFEMAAAMQQPDDIRRALTFVIIGAGPTGVELAGSLAEIGENSFRHDYRDLKDYNLTIYLIEAGPHVLGTYSPDLSLHARHDLEKLGVKVLTDTRVEYMNGGVVVAGNEQIYAQTIIWAAGNTASPLLKTLDTPLDRSGRAIVTPDLSLPDDPDVFVIGDAAHYLPQGQQAPLPGVAQVAMQMGSFVAGIIKDQTPRNWRRAFSYWDKGNMATIGRAKAILESGKLKMTGLPAWLAWSVVHVLYLVTFRNRFRVFAEWMWLYITFKPGTKIIYWQNNEIKRRAVV